MSNLGDLTAAQLMALNADIADELRRRGIARSSTNPTADVAELLFCRAFASKQAGNSNPADATCTKVI
jgi:hypothetical protein